MLSPVKFNLARRQLLAIKSKVGGSTATIEDLTLRGLTNEVHKNWFHRTRGVQATLAVSFCSFDSSLLSDPHYNEPWS